VTPLSLLGMSVVVGTKFDFEAHLKRSTKVISKLGSESKALYMPVYVEMPEE